MKILFVTPYLPYPNVPYAGEITVLNLLTELTSRGHDIYLISGLREAKDKKYLDQVNSFCTVLETIEIPSKKMDWLKALIQWGLRGFREGVSFRRKVAKSVKKHSKKINFDIIQIEHTEIAEYIEKVSNVPMVVDAVDVLVKPALRKYKLEKQVIKKIINFIKYKSTERKEVLIYRKFNKVYTRSLFDKKIILGNHDKLDISIFPTYVRLTEFADPNVNREPNTLLFLGAMDRDVNINAVQYFYGNIFPLIKQKIPDVKFYVVGNNPPPTIKHLSERDKNVVVTGFVEDIRSFYFKASVFVAPLFVGGGVIVKILDAMAAGLPVVTTSIGNEGIEAVPDRDIEIADEPKAFAEKILLLLQKPDVHLQISNNGKAFVREKYEWSRIVRGIEADYKKIIRDRVAL